MINDLFSPKQTDRLCFETELIQWIRSQLGANRTDLQYMDECPGKVTKPLDHKGTLTTMLSCLPVVMAMLRAQLAANWLLTHPVGGAIAWWGSRGSQSFSWVCLHREDSRQDRKRKKREEIKRNVCEDSHTLMLSLRTKSKKASRETNRILKAIEQRHSSKSSLSAIGNMWELLCSWGALRRGQRCCKIYFLLVFLFFKNRTF